MAGGISILLVIVIIAVAAVIAFVVIGIGGGVESRRKSRGEDDGSRPKHTRVSDSASRSTTVGDHDA